jgi:hypothetical protein
VYTDKSGGSWNFGDHFTVTQTQGGMREQNLRKICT